MVIDCFIIMSQSSKSSRIILHNFEDNFLREETLKNAFIHGWDE